MGLLPQSRLTMITKLSKIFFSFLLLILVSETAISQQSADPLFKPTVEIPAFTKNFPRVLFDEAHFNAETTTGRYKPFADLLFSDGYHIVVNRTPFTKESLQSFKILVIVNPLGAEDSDDVGANGPAFSAEECDAIANWIRGGGSLLLVADPDPFAGATQVLAQRLEVEMNRGHTTDPANADKDSNDSGLIVYSRDNHLLAPHAITNGRSETERVNRVMTFMGQSLKGPASSESFLKLADTAVDNMGSPVKSASATGRAQGIAYRLGKGRVVVLGDAAMLSAQVTGSDNRPFGMNTPDTDNKQLALNIMHWLSGLLK
jgi:hypothetical protein